MPSAPHQRVRFEPTGDALFDRFGSEVLRSFYLPLDLLEAYAQEIGRLGFTLEQLNEAGDLPPGCPAPPAELLAAMEQTNRLPADELLAEWAGEHGANPHYWQLRYACLKSYMRSRDPVQPHAAFVPLLEGWQRGAADAVSCRVLRGLCYYAAPDYVAKTLARKPHLSAATESDEFAEEPSSRPHSDEAQLTAEHAAACDMLGQAGLDEERLLAAAIELAPELAWPRLELAQQRVRQDRLDEALELIETAAKLRAGRHLIYPATLMQEAYWREIAPGGQLVAGILGLAFGTLRHQLQFGGLVRGPFGKLRRHCLDSNRKDSLPSLLTCLRLLAAAPFAEAADVSLAVDSCGRYIANWAERYASTGNPGRATALRDLAVSLPRLPFDLSILASEDGFRPAAADDQEADGCRSLELIHEGNYSRWQAEFTHARKVLLPRLEALLDDPLFSACWNDPPRMP